MKTAVLSIFVAVIVVVAGFTLRWGKQDDAESTIQLSAAGQAALALAESRGCLACHSTDGSEGIGPTWAGSYGTVRVLQDGSTFAIDDVYLRRSIQEPAAQVVSGFENVMVPPELDETELDMLIALIRELGGVQVIKQGKQP